MDDLKTDGVRWHGGCGPREPQPPASALRNEPLHRMFKAVHRSFLQRALQEMRAEGIAELYPGATSLLLHLGEEDGLPLSELARRSDLENSTLTPLVDELERHQLVHRVRAADDRRVVLVYLTERGRELEPRLRRMWLDLQERALAGITEAELASLHELMARIAGNLDGPG